MICYQFVVNSLGCNWKILSMGDYSDCGGGSHSHSDFGGSSHSHSDFGGSHSHSDFGGGHSYSHTSHHDPSPSHHYNSSHHTSHNTSHHPSPTHVTSYHDTGHCNKTNTSHCGKTDTAHCNNPTNDDPVYPVNAVYPVQPEIYYSAPGSLSSSRKNPNLNRKNSNSKITKSQAEYYSNKVKKETLNHEEPNLPKEDKVIEKTNQFEKNPQFEKTTQFENTIQYENAIQYDVAPAKKKKKEKCIIC